MESTQKISSLYKKYNKLLLYTFLSSCVCVSAIYIYTKNIGSSVFGLLPFYSAIVYILIHERYYSLLIPTVLCTSMITFITIQSILHVHFKINKDDVKPSYYLFHVLLIFLSLFTLYSFLASMSFYKSASQRHLSQGNKGDPGKQGERGNRGKLLINSSNIIEQQLLLFVQTDFVELIQEKHPQLIYHTNKKYVENISFLSKVRSLPHTPQGVKYIQQQKLKQMQQQNVNSKDKSQACCDENKVHAHAIDYLRNIVKQWIRVFLKYENGESYLRSSYDIETKWSVLVTENDKNKNLTSPLEELNTNEVWNWGK